MEMLTPHMISEYTVSLIRGRPPSVIIVVCLFIFLLIFIFLCWRILQLKWQLLEKEKYIEQLDSYIKLLLNNRSHYQDGQQESKTDDTNEISSFLFTEKTRKEKKQKFIIQALRQSFVGRYDKARALGDELTQWQEDGYVERNYNAKVVHDELSKLISDIPVSYQGFRKYYNK